MQARIYMPTKTTTQSGQVDKKWVLEYILQDHSRMIDGVMGWTSSSDMNQELLLNFSTKEQAEKYAKKHGIEYEIIECHSRKMKKKSYADNFK